MIQFDYDFSIGLKPPTSLMYPYENNRRTTAQVMERSDDDVPTFKWVIFRFYVSGANPAGVQADQNGHINLGGGFNYVLIFTPKIGEDFHPFWLIFFRWVGEKPPSRNLM